jgi:hypothetical protein
MAELMVGTWMLAGADGEMGEMRRALAATSETPTARRGRTATCM